MGHTTLLAVGICAPQGLSADVLTSDRLDDLRSGDKHLANLLYHENKIGKGRRIDSATGAGTQDD